MAYMTALRVERAEQIAAGIHLFELRDPDGRELPEFNAGSHIAIVVPTGDVRKYSLCNDPCERDRYVIAVKKEAAGRGGSISLVDAVKAGDLVMSGTPENSFALDERAASFLFIAGGIGITPIMAMIRHLKSTGCGRFKLYYCTRNAHATAFLDELSAPAYRGQVTIHHDNGDPAQALDLWPLLERPAGAHLYCCGPRAMMEAVRDMTGHWSRSAVHFESFVDAAQTRTVEDHAFSVRLARTGEVVEVPANTSILEALRFSGHTVPSSCESGTCGTCKTRLVRGAADHRDLVLSEAERSEYIMVCVSRARSTEAELVIDR
ncbi:MAG TPA: PDR/VanB family oxidoreductase [Burkholderiales bacterium]|nr:PDR/VanB family oxidoreductase [Burkholderiales bacterium]